MTVQKNFVRYLYQCEVIGRLSHVVRNNDRWLARCRECTVSSESTFLSNTDQSNGIYEQRPNHTFQNLVSAAKAPVLQ